MTSRDPDLSERESDGARAAADVQYDGLLVDVSQLSHAAVQHLSSGSVHCAATHSS